MKKKNIIVVVCIIILVLIIGGILLLPKLFNNSGKENKVKSLTREFYSYYYDEISKSNNAKDFLKNYTESGLKINLGDIEVYLDGKTGKNGDYSLLEKCDLDKSYATIYPKSPFDKKSIEIKVNLECK